MTPHFSGTDPNAVAAALYHSLDILHGTIQSSAKNFATAAQSLSLWAQQLKKIEYWANGAGWEMARKRAMERYKLEHPNP
jgi:hypothetical protein